jgi:hypothetical protein
MANEACNAVRDGRIQIIPSQFEDTWFRFLLLFFHLPSIHILLPQKHSHVTSDIRFCFKCDISVDSVFLQVVGKHSRLVYFTAALVGSPSACILHNIGG